MGDMAAGKVGSCLVLVKASKEVQQLLAWFMFCLYSCYYCSVLLFALSQAALDLDLFVLTSILLLLYVLILLVILEYSSN